MRMSRKNEKLFKCAENSPHAPAVTTASAPNPALIKCYIKTLLGSKWGVIKSVLSRNGAY